jgi:catechol 2,3-dioxygenase-like lactoylglutathione lyase family enzyme
MISRIDHISIAVNDYANARHFFEDILGAIPGAGDKNHKLKYHAFLTGTKPTLSL